MSYNTATWKDVDPDDIYDSLEEALMTCCHICGERLEWDVKTVYNSYLDAPTIAGTSFSCGIQYSLAYDHARECYRITIDV